MNEIFLLLKPYYFRRSDSDEILIRLSNLVARHNILVKSDGNLFIFYAFKAAKYVFC